MEVFQVSAKTNPRALAGAIAAITQKPDKEIALQVIGGGALNQAVKAVAIARGFVASEGVDLVIEPSFTIVTVNDEKKTGMKLTLRKA